MFEETEIKAIVIDPNGNQLQFRSISLAKDFASEQAYLSGKSYRLYHLFCTYRNTGAENENF